MTTPIQVVKRDGKREPLILDKFHRVVDFSCNGFSGVSASELELQTQLRFFDGITTDQIQETLIRAAADLISEDAPNYQYVASHLINYHLRKKVYGQYEPPELKDHVRRLVDLGVYTSDLLCYSDDELDSIDDFIDHDRDYDVAYAGMEQFRGKYLVRDRVSGQLYETPQFVFVCVSMLLFRNYPDRLRWVREFYDLLSTHVVSMPTPIMAGLRTPIKQFSSCVLIECDDSLDSINAGTSAIVQYVAKRAGIGIGAGRIRALGSRIRGGDATSSGCIPFYRMFQAAVNSCSQGSVRKGSATLNFPCWHLEVEDLIVLKNGKGTEDNRLRHMDYCVQLNLIMYERLLADEHITLFCPNDVPEVYDAFFRSNDEFRRLYEAAEKNLNIRKKRVRALDLFTLLLQERKDTGRIYVMNVDHCNEHGSFLPESAPVRMTNLCAEVVGHTKPLKSVDDPAGEIFLCTLAAVNLGKVNSPSELQRPCEMLIRALNELLDYQDYMLPAARNSTMLRRPLGIGITNLAYFLAKRDVKYSTVTRDQLGVIHEYAEAFSWYLIDASCRLAEERGAAVPGLADTKYGLGLVPIDHYKVRLDEYVDPVYKMDWGDLKTRLKQHGIYNSTLMAGMPAETSAQVTNSTNGFEPPRALVSVKKSKEGVLKQVVPGIRRLKNKYDLLWDQKSPEGYLKICAVFTKFFDMALSTNTSYNPEHSPGGELQLSQLLSDLLLSYKLGLKTLYYQNTKATNDDGRDTVEPEICEGCTV